MDKVAINSLSVTLMLVNTLGAKQKGMDNITGPMETLTLASSITGKNTVKVTGRKVVKIIQINTRAVTS